MNSTLIALLLALQSAFHGLIGPMNSSICPASNKTEFNVSDWKVQINLTDYASDEQDGSLGCPLNVALGLSGGCLQPSDIPNMLNRTIQFNTTGHLDLEFSVTDKDIPPTNVDAEINWFGGMGGATENTSRLCGNLTLSVNTTLKSRDLNRFGPENLTIRRQGDSYSSYDSYREYESPVYEPRRYPSYKKTKAPSMRIIIVAKKKILKTLAPTIANTEGPTPEDTEAPTPDDEGLILEDAAFARMDQKNSSDPSADSAGSSELEPDSED